MTDPFFLLALFNTFVLTWGLLCWTDTTDTLAVVVDAEVL